MFNREGILMIPRREKEVPFFEFPNLAAYGDIRHGVFTRNGGSGAGSYESLNVGLGVGDRRETVSANRRRVSACLGNLRLVFIRQVHGADVAVLRNDETDAATLGRPLTGDALVTNISGVGLVIQTADCQAVMLYDSSKRVVANIHAGWRGSVLNIIGETVRTMTSCFGCNPADLQAGIGPSLGPCCGEFIHYRDEIPPSFWKYKDGRRHFDFWAASRDQLMDAGVPETGICASRLCTRCRTDLFFSYRGEGSTGRMAMVIGLG